MSARCGPPTTRWPCTTPGTCTRGATRASASGWSGPTTWSRPARTPRTRSSGRAATRCTGTPRTTPSPTPSRTSEAAMSFDDAYSSLTDHDDDARWAYGTGFADPLAGVPTAVPSEVDRAALAAYCLGLGDDALVMSHRLQQWVTRAPELEDELALANIGLDLLGQARLLLTRAGEAEGTGRDEDALAYRRDAAEFRNVRLAERGDDDFAHMMARLLAFATWRLALFGALTGAPDPVLAAIAAKGAKELAYHREYAAGWVVRLGDGTPESHARMQAAVDALWPLLGELFRADPALRAEFDTVWDQVFEAATLQRPPDVDFPGPYGRDGDHTRALTDVLDEMQSVARSLPGGVW